MTLSLSRKEDARRLRLRLQSIALGTREKEERAKDPLFGKSAERIWRRLIETREKIETNPKSSLSLLFFLWKKGRSVSSSQQSKNKRAFVALRETHKRREKIALLFRDGSSLRLRTEMRCFGVFGAKKASR